MKSTYTLKSDEYEEDDLFVKRELLRGVGILCGEKCLSYEKDEKFTVGNLVKMSNGEQLCMNRCANKFYNAKVAID